MSTTQQKVRPYTAGAVSRASGLTRDQIEVWCRAGILACRNNGSGTGVPRQFTETDVAIARVLARLWKNGRGSHAFLRKVSHELELVRSLLFVNRFVIVDGDGTCELADSPHEVLLSIDLMHAKQLTSVVELW